MIGFILLLEACLFNAISSRCFARSASLDRHSHSPVTGKTAAGKSYVQPKELKACRLKNPSSYLTRTTLFCVHPGPVATGRFTRLSKTSPFVGRSPGEPAVWLGTAQRVSDAAKAKRPWAAFRGSYQSYLPTIYSHEKMRLETRTSRQEQRIVTLRNLQSARFNQIWKANGTVLGNFTVTNNCFLELLVNTMANS